MIPQALIREAQKQSKAALTQAALAFPTAQRIFYSVINHPLVPKDKIYIIGNGPGMRQIRGS